MSQVVYKSLDFLGFPNYRVGDDGSVWSNFKKKGLGMGLGSKTISTSDWKLVKTTMHYDYRWVVLCNGKNRRRNQVHRLVLLAFVGPCPEGMECCHNDGNSTNNKLSNLRWGTRKENAADRVRHGRQIRGEKVAHAKATDQIVRDIRRMFSEGRTRRELAVEFKLNQCVVNRIIRRHSWKHVV